MQRLQGSGQGIGRAARGSQGIAGRIQTDLTLQGLGLHPVRTNISNGFTGAGLGPLMSYLLIYIDIYLLFISSAESTLKPLLHPLSCLISPTVQFEELQTHDKQVKIKLLFYFMIQCSIHWVILCDFFVLLKYFWSFVLFCFKENYQTTHTWNNFIYIPFLSPRTSGNINIFLQPTKCIDTAYIADKPFFNRRIGSIGFLKNPHWVFETSSYFFVQLWYQHSWSWTHPR